MAGAAPTSLVLVLAALAACGVEPQRLESVLPTLPPVEALVFAPTPSVFERAEGLAALPADTALVMVVDPPAIRALAVEVADAPVDEVFPALSLWASGISMSSPEAMGIATGEPWGAAWLHLPGVEVLADQAPIDRVEPPALEVRVVFARLESEEALLGSLARSVDARERTLFAEPIGDAHWYHSEQERPERAVVIRGEQVFFIEQLARVDGVADVTRDVARRLATIERPASLLGRAGFARQVAAASLGPVGIYLQPGPWLRRAAATIERRRHPPPFAPEVSPSWPSFDVERPLLEARAAALDALATRVDALAGGLDLGPRGLRGRLSVFWRGAPLAVAAETPRLPAGGMSVALAPELLPELLTVVAGERVMAEVQGALDDEPLARRLDGRLRMIQAGGAWRVDLGLATEVPDALRGRVARALRTPVQREEGWLRVGAAAFAPWVPSSPALAFLASPPATVHGAFVVSPTFSLPASEAWGIEGVASAPSLHTLPPPVEDEDRSAKLDELLERRTKIEARLAELLAEASLGRRERWAAFTSSFGEVVGWLVAREDRLDVYAVEALEVDALATLAGRAIWAGVDASAASEASRRIRSLRLKLHDVTQEIRREQDRLAKARKEDAGP